jgi:DNA N-6-adenine-methyltransferase (Dam)
MVSNFMQGEPDRERYTPAEVVIAVKDTLGTIDLDPASTETVNKLFIRAKRFYTEKDNGLDRNNPWNGKVFINPPGGNRQPEFFWERLIIEYEQGNVTAGVHLAFNIEHLQQSQNWAHPMVHWPFCIPSQRLQFYYEEKGLIQPPPHRNGFASAIIYVGKNTKRFAKAFSNLGAVIIPRNVRQ